MTVVYCLMNYVLNIYKPKGQMLFGQGVSREPQKVSSYVYSTTVISSC